MENQPTIQERLNAIVYLEIKELKDVLDKWFNADESRKSLVFGDDPDKMPALNLYGGSIDDIAHYAVKRIEVDDRGYSLVLNRNMSAYGDEFSEDDNVYQYFDMDRDNFIPGELSKLTEFIKKWIDPLKSVCKFSKHQEELIQDFIRAYKNLDREGVSFLYDMREQDLYFYNENNVTDININNGKGKEMDLDKLQKIDFGVYNFMADEDTLFVDTKD